MSLDINLIGMDPFDVVALIELNQDLIIKISSFIERDVDILVSNIVYGFTMKELSKKYGVTPVRIRQIREKALKRLRLKFPNQPTDIQSGTLDFD